MSKLECRYTHDCVKPDVRIEVTENVTTGHLWWKRTRTIKKMVDPGGDFKFTCDCGSIWLSREGLHNFFGGGEERRWSCESRTSSWKVIPHKLLTAGR